MNKRSSRKSRFLSPGWLMFLSALLCVGLVPLVQATMLHSSEESKRYHQLTELTESERLKVQHSFEEFQKLSPAKQESYRDLDRRLNQEDLRLKDTLASYREFLSTLSPVDRAKVDHATSLRDRLNVINQIQEERANLRQQLETAYSMIEERYRSGESHERWPTFSDSEMEAITGLIEGRLPDSALQKYKRDVKTVKSGTARFAWAAIAAVDAWKSGPPGPLRSSRELFPEDLMEQIISETQNEEIRENFEHARQSERRTFTQEFLGRAMWTVFLEHVKDTPDISELSELLNTLDEEEKKSLMSQDPGSMYRDLKHKYFEKKPTEVSKALDELRKKAGPYLPRPGGGRGGRPDRPGDSGSGQDDNNRGSFNRDGERSPRGDQGAFDEGRRGRGFREGGPGERFENGRPQPPQNSSASD